jgi:hypothetical protein
MDTPEIRLRESPRIDVTARVRLQLASSAQPIDAAVLDLSATGMGLATAVAAPKPAAGESCAFAFALDGLRVEGRGVVVWSRRARPDRSDAPNVGVRFQRLEGAGEREVAAVVQQGLASARRPSIARREALLASEPRRPAEARAPAPATLPSSAAVAVTAPTVAVPAPRLPLEKPDRPGQEPTPVEPKLEVAPRPEVAPREAARPQVEIAYDTAAAPIGKGRRIWIGVLGAAVVTAAIVGLPSLFEENDAARAPGASTVAVEPVAAAPVAAASGDGAAALDSGGSIADAAVLAAGTAEDAAAAAVPAAVAAPVSLATISGAAAGAEREARAVSSDAVAAPAPAVAAAAPDRAGPADPAPAMRARRIVAIEPGAVDGVEVVVLRADAPFREQDVFAALIGPDPPRYLLRLSGIERRWRPADLDVGSPLIRRVRTGLHSTPRGPELHVVLDLSTRAVEHSFAIEGEALRVSLRPRTP